MTQVTIIPLDRPVATRTFDMGPKGAQLTDGTANWREIKRPRRRPVLEFEDESLCKQKVSIMLDRWLINEDIETDFRTVMALSARNAAEEPTPVRVLGPIYYPDLTWQIAGIDLSGILLRGDDGRLMRQEMVLELVEYVTIGRVTAPASPAAEAQQRVAVPAQRTHTVAAGDTLWALATRYLGSGARYREIADLNGVGDPRRLRIGTVLRIPG